MVVFWIFLAIIFVIIIFLILVFLSILEIEISKLEVNTKLQGNKTNNKYKIKINFKFLNLIKWIQVSINSKKIGKMKNNKTIKKLKLKLIKNILKNKNNIVNIKQLKMLNILNIKLKIFRFYLQLETEDAIFTSYLVAIISSVIAILMSNGIEKYDENNYKFKVIPEYGCNNYINLKVDCIINVKMVHIIKVIYIILQKRSELKNARTSNRRTYGYSHE